MFYTAPKLNELSCGKNWEDVQVCVVISLNEKKRVFIYAPYINIKDRLILLVQCIFPDLTDGYSYPNGTKNGHTIPDCFATADGCNAPNINGVSCDTAGGYTGTAGIKQCTPSEPVSDLDSCIPGKNLFILHCSVGCAIAQKMCWKCYTFFSEGLFLLPDVKTALFNLLKTFSCATFVHKFSYVRVGYFMPNKYKHYSGFTKIIEHLI